MKISRRAFLTTLAGIVPVSALSGLDFTKLTDVAAGWKRLAEDPLVFLVETDGSLCLENYDIGSRRRDIYCVTANVNSLADLERELGSCQPLCWRFNDLYWDFLGYVDEEETRQDWDEDDEPPPAVEEPIPAWGEPGFYIPFRAGDKPWPSDYDGDPAVLKRWSEAIGEEAFVAEARKAIDEWLDGEPDGGEYDDDYFDIAPTGSEYAFEYFSNETRISMKIGIDVVEGDRPGSNYSGARLIVPIDEANERCRKLDLPYVFREA